MSIVDPKLETLIVVSEMKNYSAAARALNLTQPAVSQHISALEKEFDIRIFNRTGNNISITPLGEILVRYARQMVSISKELATKIDDEKKQTKSLTIGITHSSEGNLVPEVLATLTKHNPRMTIKIVSDTIRNLYDKLSTYEIDLAVVEGKYSDDRYSNVLLDTDSIVAVMSKDNPLSNYEVLNIDQIKKERLILRTSTSATRNLFAAQLEANNMSLDDFNVILEMDNTAAIKELVKKNIGMSILPKSVVLTELKEKSLIALPIENMNMITEINLAFLKNYPNRNIIDELVRLYHKIAIIK